MSVNAKYIRRSRIKNGIRKILHGTSSRPRLSVYRSNKAIYAQLIDDLKGVTLVSCSSLEFGDSEKLNIASSKSVGLKLAEKSKASGIVNVVFDRNGYLYHGKIKSLAVGAREGGLKF